MSYRDGRRSICVSSQSGCPLTCTFCATGSMNFGRNLTESRDRRPGPALPPPRADQPPRLHGDGRADDEHRRRPRSLERLPEIGITNRRTAISTVGWVPGIERLTESERPIRLALSLHAADQVLRSELMPVNDRYPLADVLAACGAYHERRNRTVFVEYLMLDRVNDRPEQADELADVLDPHLQGQPHPLQPDRRVLRGLLPEADRRLPRAPGGARAARDRPPDPRPGHRGRLRPARGGTLRSSARERTHGQARDSDGAPSSPSTARTR